MGAPPGAPGGLRPREGLTPKAGGLGAPGGLRGTDAPGGGGALSGTVGDAPRGLMTPGGGGGASGFVPGAGAAMEAAVEMAGRRVVSFLGPFVPASVEPIRTVSRFSAPISIGFGGVLSERFPSLGQPEGGSGPGDFLRLAYVEVLIFVSHRGAKVSIALLAPAGDNLAAPSSHLFGSGRAFTIVSLAA